MSVEERQPGLTVWTIAALAALAWGLIALAFASLAPPSYIPRIFQNYHIEHFAAFYTVTLLGSAALPRTKLLRIGLSLGLLAAVFALIRMTTQVHRLSYAEDLFCDIAGVLTALAPIFVARIRRISAARLD